MTTVTRTQPPPVLEQFSITAYMCSKQSGGIEVSDIPFKEETPVPSVPPVPPVPAVPIITEPGETAPGITPNPKIVTPDVAMELIPAPYGQQAMYVRGQIQVQYGPNPRYCDYEDGLQLFIECDTDGWMEGIYGTYRTPGGCAWLLSRITGEHFGMLHELRRFGNIQAGPIPKDKKDVFPDFSGDRHFQTTCLVPGERVDLEWGYYPSVGNVIETVVVSTKYFATKCLTGGWIKSIQGDVKDKGTTFTVQIEGSQYSGITRSDFYPYEVEDWVFIRKNPTSECIENYGKKPWDARTDYPGQRIACESYNGGGGLIVPLRIRGLGAYYF